jgi:hypothetical protein
MDPNWHKHAGSWSTSFSSRRRGSILTSTRRPSGGSGLAGTRQARSSRTSATASPRARARGATRAFRHGRLRRAGGSSWRLSYASASRSTSTRTASSRGRRITRRRRQLDRTCRHPRAFGTGNYGYNRGYVYVDDASFMRWTIAWLVDKSNLGTAPGATSSTTIAFTTTESAASGAWIFVVVAWCCAGALSKPGSPVSPSGGEAVAGGRGVNG